MRRIFLYLSGICLMATNSLLMPAGAKRTADGKKKVISQEVDTAWLSLKRALITQDCLLVDTLLKDYRIDINKQDERGDSLLKIAVCVPCKASKKSRNDEQPDNIVGARIVKALLDAKADVKQRDQKGIRPLEWYFCQHIACCGSLGDVLLNHGAPVDLEFCHTLIKMRL